MRDLVKQAEALAPMLDARPGQRVLLMGQSSGAPVATRMAQRYPERVPRRLAGDRRIAAEYGRTLSGAAAIAEAETEGNRGIGE